MFLKILEFVHKLNGSNLKLDQAKFENTVRTTNFEILKKKEKDDGFFESKLDKENKKIPFFNKGSSRNWKKTLDTKIKNKIEAAFKNEMKELNYL